MVMMVDTTYLPNSKEGSRSGYYIDFQGRDSRFRIMAMTDT